MTEREVQMLPYVAVFVGDFIGGEGVVLLLLEGVFVFYEWYSVNFEVSSFTFYLSSLKLSFKFHSSSLKFQVLCLIID